MFRIACMCCYFSFLMYIIITIFFCGEQHYNFILHIHCVDFASYFTVCNLIVSALYEYLLEANNDYYYYYNVLIFTAIYNCPYWTSVQIMSIVNTETHCYVIATLAR